MPAMLEPLILDMDFLASIGTTLRCGTASLTPSRRRPGERETIRSSETEHDNQGNQSEPQPRPRPRRPLSRENTPRTSNTPLTEPRLGIANHDIGIQNDRDANAPEEPHRVHETHNPATRQENDENNNTGGGIRVSIENDEARIAKNNDREHQEDHNQEKHAENSRGIPDKDTENQGVQGTRLRD